MLISAVLIAAGQSTRMGAFKPLLPWFGTTLLEAQITALRKGGAHETCVVSGHNHDELAAAMPVAGVKLVRNLSYKEGKTTSIKAGISACGQQAQAFIILAADQPRPPEFIKRLVAAHAAAAKPITIPRLNNRGGHPIILDASLKPQLMQMSEQQQGMRGLLQRHARDIHHFNTKSPIALLDLNTQTAYKVALKDYPAMCRELEQEQPHVE